MQDHAQASLPTQHREPWNKDMLIGVKPPLRSNRPPDFIFRGVKCHAHWLALSQDGAIHFGIPADERRRRS